MTRSFILNLAFILLFFTFVKGQHNLQSDSVNHYTLKEVTVTAAKSPRRITDIAGRIEIINSETIHELPVYKPDEILRTISGIQVNKSFGNYTMRPVVTVRNLGGDEQSRTLVLMDGIPVNVSDEGGVNWNRLNALNIEKLRCLRARVHHFTE
ncbi:MAG: Plug domain-containing protein [Bacteroidales bacterium]|nr:Plug domain-containing protein [Bacteroidales bacterium]